MLIFTSIVAIQIFLNCQKQDYNIQAVKSQLKESGFWGVYKFTPASCPDSFPQNMKSVIFY